MPQDPSDTLWVNRACDRCRRRKAKCDGTRSCENCANAELTCTHSAPILKRGPRRSAHRSTRVEDRLRSLEELIVSIAGGAGQSNPVLPDTLSAGEVQRIRDAAQTSQSPDIPEFSWINYSPSPIRSVEGSGGFSGVGEVQFQVDGGADTANFALGLDENSIAEQSVAGPSSWTMPGASIPHAWDVPGDYSQNPNGFGQQAMTAPMTDISLGRNSPVSPERDLLYRDREGQTKFLGPSSGMPMLDSLKPPVPTRWGLEGANDSWFRLSASIGLDFDRPDQAFQSPGIEGPTISDPLWDQLTAVCSPDLIDSLVRSYFTISYLLWPILHVPSFMKTWEDRTSRNDPSFVTLLSTLISLSSRYTDAPGLTLAIKDDIRLFASKTVLAALTSPKANIYLVQALFNMSVVQEGTANPSLLWTYLSPAISASDEWTSFNVVDVELRKRLMWALYSQNIKASATYGRPPLLRLVDLGIEEPIAADDIHIIPDGATINVGTDQHSVMAGFIIAVRLHMILERVITRINGPRQAAVVKSLFVSTVLSASAIPERGETSDLDLLSSITDGLGPPSEWLYDPKLLMDPDNLRFFQATRIFALQLFIRLLVARHDFTTVLAKETNQSNSGFSHYEERQAALHRLMRCALSIIGLYSTTDRHRRLHFFGAHAIVQVSQAGTALVGLILHLRSCTSSREQNIFHLALQGLPVAISVLRQLGRSRPAGHRAANVLVEFSRACSIPVFTEYAGILQTESPGGNSGAEPQGEAAPDTDNQEAKIEVEVPMLRSLKRRSPAERTNTINPDGSSLGAEAGFEAWLGIALQVEGAAVGS